MENNQKLKSCPFCKEIPKIEGLPGEGTESNVFARVFHKKDCFLYEYHQAIMFGEQPKWNTRTPISFDRKSLITLLNDILLIQGYKRIRYIADAIISHQSEILWTRDVPTVEEIEKIIEDFSYYSPRTGNTKLITLPETRNRLAKAICKRMKGEK